MSTYTPSWTLTLTAVWSNPLSSIFLQASVRTACLPWKSFSEYKVIYKTIQPFLSTLRFCVFSLHYLLNELIANYRFEYAWDMCNKYEINNNQSMRILCVVTLCFVTFEFHVIIRIKVDTFVLFEFNRDIFSSQKTPTRVYGNIYW